MYIRVPMYTYMYMYIYPYRMMKKSHALKIVQINSNSPTLLYFLLCHFLPIYNRQPIILLDLSMNLIHSFML